MTANCTLHILNLSVLESSQKLPSFMITVLSLWGFLLQWWSYIPPLAAGCTLDEHVPRLNSSPWLLNPHRKMLDPHFFRSCSLTAHSFVWIAVKPTSHLCYLPRESVRTHASVLRSMAVFCYSIKPWQARVPSFGLLMCQTRLFISNQYKACFLKEELIHGPSAFWDQFGNYRHSVSWAMSQAGSLSLWHGTSHVAGEEGGF